IRLAKEGAASLSIAADDADNLAGTDPKRMPTYLKNWRPLLKPYYEIAMSDGIAWCVSAAASPAWARRVFPGVPEKQAVEKLWDFIFKAVRLAADDHAAAWHAQLDRLSTAKARHNDKSCAAFRFRAPATDLRVGLAEGHLRDGGSSRTPQDVSFV